MPKGDSGRKKKEINLATYYKMEDGLRRIHLLPDYLNEKMTDDEIRSAIIEAVKRGEHVNVPYGMDKTDLDGRYDIPVGSKYADTINKINNIKLSDTEGYLSYEEMENKIEKITSNFSGKDYRLLANDMNIDVSNYKDKSGRLTKISLDVIHRFAIYQGGSTYKIKRNSLSQMSTQVDEAVHTVKHTISHNQIGRERLHEAMKGLSLAEKKLYRKCLKSWPELIKTFNKEMNLT